MFTDPVPTDEGWVEKVLNIQDKYDVNMATNGDNAQMTILFPLEDLGQYENMGAVMDKARQLIRDVFVEGTGPGGGGYYGLFPGKDPTKFYPVRITIAPSKLGGKTPEDFVQEFINDIVKK